MNDEAPNIVYGRLLESAHLSGYGFERMTDELEWLLDGDRWQQVGPGYVEVNVFLRSIDLSAFNLTEKKKLHKRIKELQPTASPKAIGKATGTPRSTVRGHLDDEGGGSATPPPRDQDRSGPKVADPPPFERSAKDVAKLNRRDAEKAQRGDAAKARYLERQAEWDAAASLAGDRVDVRCGDFRDVLANIEPDSVDAVVTDPPYADEFLELWSDLAALAATILRPGAPMIVWSGQYRLPEVLARIGEHLEYRWTLCLDQPGSNARFRHLNMIQTWKPVIVATRGAWGPHDWFRDRVISPIKDQALYEWQQHPDPAAELIARYVPDGGLVVDPFTGVGSFGVAAVTTGRRFVGAELDVERHATARARIIEALG